MPIKNDGGPWPKVCVNYGVENILVCATVVEKRG